MKFCPTCGSRVKANHRAEATTCANCGTLLGGDPPKMALLESFPFPTLRPSQKEVLGHVEAALSQSKRYIILEAPVGFGKSAIAAALCRHLGSAYLLTSTKQLQSQYSVDFGFPTVTGKSNFTCLVPTSRGKYPPCSKGRCEADWTLSECPHFLTFEEYDEHARGACGRKSKCRTLKDGKFCPYYEQKWDAFREPIMVANYPFFLSELSYTDDVQRRKLLVCDEAHDLERQMVGFASYSLRRSTLGTYSTDGGSAPAIPDMGLEDAGAWSRPLDDAKQTLEGFINANQKDGEMQDKVASCRDALDSLKGFADVLGADPSNWVVNGVRKSLTAEGESTVEEVVFQPLGVSDYTSRLFDAADTVLLMSATVFSKDVFCRTLGIPEDDATFVSVEGSAFPVENRPIHALNAAQLSRATMDSSMGAIARAVDEVMSRHAGEKGIIHTTSYQQARYIMEHVSEYNRARLSSTENVSSRSALLQAHGDRDESVLISPSLYQGVDLKDDLSRFQILVKVPFPDLSERRTRVKLERDPGWYDWQTALRLVQTYGRSVRSETDHAVTYVLDSNFTRFVGTHRALFPGYFLEALTPLT
ncbi:MAG: DEAD/DEAH box helicase family protein [Nitrososphaerota archaeon]|nr:DEAD/DEAH box helicase family protein [Nitrososphaerota archaeon]MDG6960158.1 DEAD/DEAH box helicase family protein [Nitrososphaerota archaeon]